MLDSRRRNREAGERRGVGDQGDPQRLLQQLIAVCAGSAQRGRRGNGSERQRPAAEASAATSAAAAAAAAPRDRRAGWPPAPPTGNASGEDDNFACRLQCRNCGRHGPRSSARPAGGGNPSVSLRPAAGGPRRAPTPAPWAPRLQTSLPWRGMRRRRAPASTR